ncbi:DUF6232 family protein [Actinoplanes sp. KI2]|uniref:DUF6232 family protein n=1 Tax=Actinoplanes sp. KI2 TaxID=2983315 RepID=UPI0021D56BBE|nr:DUF6232 family protein [Actinoplanes sp. KI2]MCU7727783.1 DUF6232 family protein [Actinoplanes sp. KI2]
MSNSNTSADDRTYYPGPGIVVTGLYIETSEARYRLRDLILEDPSYFYAYKAMTAALYCGVVEFLLAMVVAVVLGSAVWLCLAGAVVAIGLAGAVLIDGHRNPRRMELAAWYEGRRVLLFASNDRRRFEQVRRAVIRARESGRRPRP